MIDDCFDPRAASTSHAAERILEPLAFISFAGLTDSVTAAPLFSYGLGLIQLGTSLRFDVKFTKFEEVS